MHPTSAPAGSSETAYRTVSIPVPYESCVAPHTAGASAWACALIPRTRRIAKDQDRFSEYVLVDDLPSSPEDEDENGNPRILAVVAKVHVMWTGDELQETRALGWYT
ncbi:hypothetical protein Hypma_001513 [Hypsizygus marmoreus]|uniref:Uncharacterized protein n=1 Tax=Hypsizygus marmoreus TaxID=39966 RepID=A0A369K3Y4_HYPMA|nr:hypothetical protein Hypma_001513 [Hypsizygus marmoreus]